jgi:hypothetical protein
MAQAPFSVHPRANEVRRKIADKQELVLLDESGRIYGFIDIDKLTRDDAPPSYVRGMIEAGEIDGQNTQLLWVWLPQARPGKWQKKQSNTPSLSVGDDLTFPEEGEVIDLYNYRSEELHSSVLVMSYPEQRKRITAKTNALIVRVV